MTDRTGASEGAVPGTADPVAPASVAPTEQLPAELPVPADSADPAPDPAPATEHADPATLERDEELSRRLQARTEELFGTGAIPIQQTPVTGPTTAELRWAEPEPVRTGLGGSALAFAIAALGGSFVVAWMFPLGIFALVLGIIAVRRPAESSRLGWWAVGLSVLSLVYSAGWAWWLGRGLGWWP